MVKLTQRYLMALVFLLCAAGASLLTIQWQHTRVDWTSRQETVRVVGLPDLALGFESTWLRHRSLAALGSIFPEGPGLMVYYPADFTFTVHLTERD